MTLERRQTFDSRLNAGANNIDLLRLFGAVVVLAHHSFIMTGVAELEPTGSWFNHATDLGTIVVAMFFVFSGFLVSRSALRSKPRDFFRARASRIYPAYLVTLVVQALAIGPAMTTLPLLAYLADPDTWRAILRGVIFSPPLGLPGVFADNPLPYAVNGSLWTLRFEASFWVMLAVMAPLGLLGRVPITLIAGVALCAVVPASGYGLKVFSIVSYLADFLIGAAFYAWRTVIPHRAWLALLAAVALVAGCQTVWAPIIIGLTVPYIVLYLGLCAPVLRLPDDISYGAYLYAFPVQQVLVALAGPAMGPWGLSILSLPLTLLCAIASRRLIELPTQRRRPSKQRAIAGAT